MPVSIIKFAVVSKFVYITYYEFLFHVYELWLRFYFVFTLQCKIYIFKINKQKSFTGIVDNQQRKDQNGNKNGQK